MWPRTFPARSSKRAALDPSGPRCPCRLLWLAASFPCITRECLRYTWFAQTFPSANNLRLAVSFACLKVYVETQNGVIYYFGVLIWWSIFMPWAQWKFCRIAFPVCPGLAPVRRKLILGGTVLLNLVGYFVTALARTPGEPQWRSKLFIGYILVQTAAEGITSLFPFLHMNAWSQTPSRTRNEIAWLVVIACAKVSFGVEYWLVFAVQLPSSLQ